jgi:hypothetical protein
MPMQVWWARRDLNPQPKDYESSALTVELQARIETLRRIVHGPGSGSPVPFEPRNIVVPHNGRRRRLFRC